MRLSAHFTLSELCATGTGLPNVPDAAAIEALRALVGNVLEPLRVALGLPLHVSSGYRSPAVNAAAGGAATSQHLRGEAADIWVSGIPAEDLARRIVALGLPVDQLIVESLPAVRATAETWVHVSHRAGRLRGELLQRTAPGSYAAWRP